LDDPAFLISRIIQEQSDDFSRMFLSQLSQQITNTQSVNVRIVRDGNNLMGDGIKCPKHVKAFSSCRRIDEATLKAPQEA
jgi:hypothetical protein